MEQSNNKIAPGLSVGSIIAIVIVLAVFGVGIYFISKLFAQTCATGLQFDTTLNKCIPVCSAPQINGPGGDCQCPFPESQEGSDCSEKCADDQERCGTVCIGKNDDCVNGAYCPPNKACNNDTVCCPDGQICIAGNCVFCQPGQIDCGGTCCTTENCADNGITKECCDPNISDKVTDSNGNSTCCEKENGNSRACYGVCCPGATKCNLKTKTCEKACENPDKDGNPLYCGTSADIGDKCVNDSPTTSICLNSSCSYNLGPNSLSNTKIPSKVLPNGIDTCLSSTGKYYITQFPPSAPGGSGVNLSSSLTADNVTGCNADDCKTFVKNIGFIDNAEPNFQTGSCTATFDCDTMLTYNNFRQNLDSNFERVQNVDNINPTILGIPSYQLCKNSTGGLYTGQICNQQQVAMYDTTTQECDCVDVDTRPNPYCSGNGNLIVNTQDGTLTCQCPNTWAYNGLCKKIEWKNFYNAEYFANYFKRLVYPGVVTIPDPFGPNGASDVFTNGLVGWSNFFVFIVCNQNSGWTVKNWSSKYLSISEYLAPATSSSSSTYIFERQTVDDTEKIDFFINVPNIGDGYGYAFYYGEGESSSYINVIHKDTKFDSTLPGETIPFPNSSEYYPRLLDGKLWTFYNTGALFPNYYDNNGRQIISPPCLVISAAKYVDSTNE